MPCFFTGICYVTDVFDRTVNCIFLNEHDMPLTLSVTYFHNRAIADSTPSTVAYQRSQSGNVYLTFGTLAFTGNVTNEWSPDRMSHAMSAWPCDVSIFLGL